MKKILVPTDFSPYAEKALRYAVQIAKKTDAEIILLHVCDLLDNLFSDSSEIVKEYNESKIRELNGAIKRLKASVEEDHKKVETKLYDGDTVDAILAAAKETNADLIVMGTLGATGLKTVFFGTKAAAVINRSTLLVITVPFNYEWAAPKNILLAVNDAQIDAAVFNPVIELSRAFGAAVKTVVFSAERAEAVELMEHSHLINDMAYKLKKQFTDVDVEPIHLSGPDFHHTIQEYVEGEKTDLVVMITHQRNFLQGLLKFSMTRQMAYHTTVPLLSLHSAHA